MESIALSLAVVGRSVYNAVRRNNTAPLAAGATMVQAPTAPPILIALSNNSANNGNGNPPVHPNPALVAMVVHAPVVVAVLASYANAQSQLQESFPVQHILYAAFSCYTFSFGN